MTVNYQSTSTGSASVAVVGYVEFQKAVYVEHQSPNNPNQQSGHGQRTVHLPSTEHLGGAVLPFKLPHSVWSLNVTATVTWLQELSTNYCFTVIEA